MFVVLLFTNLKKSVDFLFYLISDTLFETVSLGITRIEKNGEQTVTNTAYLAAEVWKAKASDLETLTKGANVELNGWLKADSYTDKDGQTRNRVTLEVSDFKVVQKEPKEGGE